MVAYNRETIVGTILKNMELHPHKLFLMSRYDKKGIKTDSIHEYTWRDTTEIVKELEQGLSALGFNEFDRNVIFAPNRPRWIFAGLATLLRRGMMVPVYPTSTTEDMWWFLYDSGAKFCFCGDQEQVEQVLAIKDDLENLKNIFVMDPMPERPHEMVLSFDELMEYGRKNPGMNSLDSKHPHAAAPEDIVALLYTAGTTGRPKGVMLSNRNLMTQKWVIKRMGFRDDDLWMGHLPLCHSYGLSADLLGCIFVPGYLGMLDSMEDKELEWGLLNFRPTVMNSVPRLWEKMYLKIYEIVQESSRTTQNLFHRGIKTGTQIFLLEEQNENIPPMLKYQMRFYQPIFNKIKYKAGLDRLRFCSTGGGPIKPEIIQFFGGMGINIYQGYGLTETSPIINVNTLTYNKIGTVGKTLPGVEEKIAEDGEILVHGPQVMEGYWNNPEANKKAFTEDGFFKTGDIGFIDQEGYLVITDRKKDLLKTSGGKFVAPQPIENEFKTDPYIEQVAIVGESRKYISALIVPNFEELGNWARERNLKYRNNSELIKHPEVIQFIRERVKNVNSKFSKHEHIKEFKLLDHYFSEYNGELTPTNNIRRKIIEDRYKNIIDSMYPD